MTGTNCDLFTHKSSRSYLNHLVSISILVTQNKHLYVTNQEIYNTDTRFKTNLYPPISNLTKYQKGPYYSEIKTFNHL
jgi:hypothetical protein